ncbi:hypothetical protein OQA88_5961 [Cercophora sp. LCS_1]
MASRLNNSGHLILLLLALTTPITASPTCRRDTLGPLDLTSNYHHPQCTRLIDDTSLTWTPWTYKPQCAHAQNSTAHYCVYTYDRIPGSTGLSVLATPEIASELGSRLHDRDPTWLHPQSQTYYLRHDGHAPAYVIRDIPGKGKGAIANRTIHAGELILREQPVVINLSELPRGLVPAQVGPMFDLAFAQMPRDDRAKIKGMARMPGTGNLLNDVQNTNAFGVSLGEKLLSAVAPDIARMNHACRPNVFTRFQAETLTFEAVAYADIQEGEELTLSYLPLNLLSEGRKLEIQKWHFNCTCSLCSSEQANKDSDRNKKRVQEILDFLQKEENRTPENGEKMFKELAEIIKVERLFAESGNFASLFAGLYFSMGNFEEATRYAYMAIDNHTQYIGHGSEKVARAKKTLELIGTWY